MTAEELARVFNGKGNYPKWRSRCPVHNSRGLTLGIYADKDRGSVHCHAGCESDDILEAVGLTWKDTLYAAKLTRKEYAELKRERRYQDAAAKSTQRQWRYWLDEVRKWEQVAALLFAQMLRGTLHDPLKVSALWQKSLEISRSRLERLRKYDKRYPHDVEVYAIVRVPRQITAQYVGSEIAEVLGLS